MFYKDSLGNIPLGLGRSSHGSESSFPFLNLGRTVATVDGMVRDSLGEVMKMVGLLLSSCLGHPLLEPGHHAVRKPKEPHAEATCRCPDQQPLLASSTRQVMSFQIIRPACCHVTPALQSPQLGTQKTRDRNSPSCYDFPTFRTHRISGRNTRGLLMTHFGVACDAIVVTGTQWKGVGAPGSSGFWTDTT